MDAGYMPFREQPAKPKYGAPARAIDAHCHVCGYCEMVPLASMISFLEDIPTTIVLDHMSVPDAAKGVNDPGFHNYLRMLDKHKNIWVKVTGPERISKIGPPYDDVVPFAN